MPGDRERGYLVGYGKPPHHSRFKKGQSGNPKGKPGGAKNLSTLVNAAVNERVIVAEDSGQRKISKLEAMIKQFVNRAARGDWRAFKILYDILQDIETRTDAVSSETSGFTAEDAKVIEHLKARLNRNKRDCDD
jgi:Family of unknown function (DUF5681)